MEHQSADVTGWVGAATTSFIGSFIDGPGEGLIVLRGDLDAAVVDRLGEHIDAFLAEPTRFLMIDARAVTSYDAGLPGLLGQTQHRLGGRSGMLQVRGLQPTGPAGPVPAVPEPDAVALVTRMPMGAVSDATTAREAGAVEAGRTRPGRHRPESVVRWSRGCAATAS
ncbi:STAS domain-containing protein [Pseudonocardia parietis]|uniref:Anti-anti-sigma regulatory factor n=1 Tax=Pseudonocardia parietis TaxID=570936 RepID=A0ABS4VX47_9PSEU|nr:hypothetical protein [Pseudonocardia parietis]MBP2368515.1 anti-anti-sigma regulatory factor [Pseudonocardia parietis]